MITVYGVIISNSYEHREHHIPKEKISIITKLDSGRFETRIHLIDGTQINCTTPINKILDMMENK